MKNKYTAGILAFFFGAFGTHKFYLDKTSSGFFRLGLFILFFMAAGGFGRFIVTTLLVLGVVEAIILFAMNEEEFDEKYNQKKKRRQERPPVQRKRDTDFERPRQFEPKKKYAGREQSWRQQQKRRYRQVKHNPHKKSGIQKYKEYDYEGAIADFQKALTISPDDIATHFNLACAYSLTEKKEKSLFHLDQAVRLGFNDFDRIRQHDAFAYLRVQPEYEAFEGNNFRLENGSDEETKDKASDPKQLESPKEDLLQEIANEDNLLEQLKILGELREKGLLTEEEFSEQKKKLLR